MKLEDNTQFRYTPDPGEVPQGESVFCGVCGDKMTEKRDVMGARGYAQAMAGGKSAHDSFRCPNYSEDWHKQVVALREAAKETPSVRLGEIMLAEVDLIIGRREATKKSGQSRAY